MSANFNSKLDKTWLLNNLNGEIMSNTDEAILGTMFDTQTDHDIGVIEHEMRQIRFLKRVCVAKILTFVPEYIVLTLLFKRKFAKQKLESFKLYFKFLTNKLNLDEFEKRLKKVMEGSIM